jgi:hypothetical protein
LTEQDAPYMLWLQIEGADYENLATWCSEKINESDVEYRKVSNRKGFALTRDLLDAAADGGGDTKEQLSAYAHEAWAGWMAYLFSKCEVVDGGMLIPQSLVERWKRQVETPYAELPEGEKDSDRKEAAVMLEIISATR